MWRSSWARVLVWFVALAGLSLSALAQESAGNIYGHAVDDNGAPVPGASVTLTGPGAPSTTVTDANGRFRFLAVPPGRYTVVVAMAGFSTVTRENVVVTLGRNTDVDVDMKLASVEASITVTSATPLLDARKTETGSTFANAELENIPSTRDIYAYMQQVPGIQTDVPNTAGIHTADVGGPAFISKGSGQSTYVLDGVTLTDNSYGIVEGGQNGASPLYFDFQTFDELAISTGGSNLELQTPGATINVVTKKGTNQIRGSARYYYTSANWQGNNQSAEAKAQGLQTDEIRFVRDYGMEMGGPVLKDRIWLWGAGSRQDFGLTYTGSDYLGNGLSSDIKLVPWNAKLDAQIAASNSFNFLFSRSNRTELGRGGSPTRPPETTRDLFIPTNLYKAEDSQVFSPSLFGSVNFAYMQADYTNVPQGGLDTQADWYDDSWHNSYWWWITKNPQHQVNTSGSKFFNTGNVSHELKFGFGYRHQLNDSATAWPGDQVFGSEFTASSTYAVVTRGANPRYELNWYYGYVGDTLTAGNLTVSAGVRYAYEQGRNLQSYGFGNQMFPEILPSITWPGDTGWPVRYETWQPRVSATYAIGKEKKTLARVSYARFADQLSNVVKTLNGIPTTGGLYYYWTDTNGDRKVQRDEVDTASGIVAYYYFNPLTLPNVPNAVQSNLKPPITDEYIIGIDHQLMDDFAVSLAGTYRYFRNIQTVIPRGTNASNYALVGYASGTAVAANGFTLPFNEPFYGLTLDEQPTGTEVINRPGANQTFYGIEVAANKRLSNKWMMRASFAWQNWKNHITPASIVNPNNDWLLGAPNINDGIAVGYGRDTIWFNASWQFNVSGLYQLPWGFAVAANLFGRQGYPQSYYVRTRTSRDDSGGTLPDTNRPTIGTLDAYRLPDVYELDLRLEKTFRFGELVVTPSVDVFNVTNQGAVLQRENLVGDFTPSGGYDPNSAFDQIVETQSPIIMRLGIRVSF
jgi:Carboxypeptidase regulatory-like domain